MLFTRKREGIDVREAAPRIEHGDLVVLDVREPYEWEAGRIRQARHIPMGELGERLHELPRDREIVAVCRSGNRSGQVADALTRAGYRIANLEGGMKAWHKAGLPIAPPQGRIA